MYPVFVYENKEKCVRYRFQAQASWANFSGIVLRQSSENERVLCEYQEFDIQVQMLWKLHS